MLREIHSLFGTGGTLVLSLIGLISAIAWLMAVTGIVIREIPKWLKFVLIPVISAVPPLSVLLLAWFAYRDRRREAIRRREQLATD